jgi:hypothetical protein
MERMQVISAFGPYIINHLFTEDELPYTGVGLVYDRLFMDVLLL